METNVEAVRAIARAVVTEELKRQANASGGLTPSTAKAIAQVIEERLADSLHLISPELSEVKSFIRRRLAVVNDALDTYESGGTFGKCHLPAQQHCTPFVRSLLGEPILPTDVEG